MSSPVPTPERADGPAGAVSPQLAELVERQLRALVLEGPFPCLGSRAALRTGSYLFSLFPDLRSADAVDAVLAGLRRFAATRRQLGDFYTYVASFVEPRVVVDEAEWDRLVWDFLQKLHDSDDEPWDPRWSKDPTQPDFALSLAGLGQLVVTLYPGASRYARRFAWPTLVFNPLEQDRANFPEEEAFLRFQGRIRDRDRALQGTVNAALPATPDDPQAPGFSGASVGADWRCPLVVRPER